MDLTNKRVCVVGAGLSGIAATTLLVKKDANVVIFDSKKKDKDEIISLLGDIDLNKVRVCFDQFPIDELKDIDLFVMSPGVPLEQPYLEESKKYNIPIWGEIELAFQCSKGKVIAITGTNGKTTTTSLVGEIMKNYYSDVFVVGNIGIPYTSIALQTTDDSIIVAEISSYQIETTDTFKPVASAVLNITPDHLMRHKTVDNYAWVKEQISKNQDKDSVVVYNYDDNYTRNMANRSKCKVLFFSMKEKLENGVYLDGDTLVLSIEGNQTNVCKVSDIRLFGTHNIENVMAAIALSVSMNVPLLNILDTIKQFKDVEHRTEFVKELKGVKFYNDSKATNPDSAIKGISSMSSPTILIGGGQDKKLPNAYDEWAKLFPEKVKQLVLFGETKHNIAETARNIGFNDIVLVDTLEEAVKTSYSFATDGDVVLLSPACASWDMFKSFEERGTLFKQYVNELE
ncbi:MAG: UDP-N-acetylmuramoylalanine--D-glutamate ligase [Clostridiales bacterium]|jgi:UDP-N-acetylmuramoylalanine--D-glutamate ligase|nr:UDP-N-acetylmuramoylalanine--D-glutamate ligase [Clostridiales bacterium]